MRKLLVLLLCLTSICATYAQTPFQLYTPGSVTQSQSTTEDANYNVGIGLGTPSTASNSGLIVANFTQVATPTLCMEVLNQISPTSTTNTAMSTVSFGVGRIKQANYPNGIGDFLIDQNGLCGVGAFPAMWGNSNIDAHLYVTDQNNDGYALFSAFTFQNIPALTVLGNSFVGVGTATPGSALTVSGQGNCPICAYTTPASILEVDNNTFGSGYTLRHYADYSLQVNRNASGTVTTDMVVDKNGYVGIGTASPAYPLDVYGNAKFENEIDVVSTGRFENDINVIGNSFINGNTLMIGTLYTQGAATFVGNVQLTNGAANGYILQSDASGHATWVNPSAFGSGQWSFATNGNIYNTNTGAVQIGNVTTPNVYSATNTSGYSLYVQGGILAEKYKVMSHLLVEDLTN